MRKWLYILALLIVIGALTYDSFGKGGSIWSKLFRLFRLADVARNNGPGVR